MTYSFKPEDITVIEPADAIRRNQKMYFRAGSFNIEEAAMHIALEAMLCGAQDVRISLDDGWVVIYADVDWLRGTDDEVFLRPGHFPEGGPNSYRSEVLLHTFCTQLVTATSSGIALIKGDSEGPLSAPLEGWERALAFKL
jgi:hypothetical protein